MIRVVVADDQSLVRSGFSALLRSAADIEVVGEASDGAEATTSAGAGFDHTGLVGEHHELRAVTSVELGEHAADVGLRRGG